MKSAYHEQEFRTKILKFVKNCNKLCKGPSVAISNELSNRATRLLCSDPESSSAQSFQESILKNKRTNKKSFYDEEDQVIILEKSGRD